MRQLFVDGSVIAGALFDCDDVIVASERPRKELVQMAIAVLARTLNRPEWVRPIEFLLQFNGRKKEENRALCLDAFGPDFPFDMIMEVRSEVLDQSYGAFGFPLMPGIEDLLAFLAEHMPEYYYEKPRMVVVSSSRRGYVEQILKTTGLNRFFCGIVGSEDVPKGQGKPKPDPFLAGANLLGLHPSQCLVFEDAVPGVVSGIAAGSHVIWIPSMEPAPDDHGFAVTAVCDSANAARTFLSTLPRV